MCKCIHCHNKIRFSHRRRKKDMVETLAWLAIVVALVFLIVFIASEKVGTTSNPNNKSIVIDEITYKKFASL